MAAHRFAGCAFSAVYAAQSAGMGILPSVDCTCRRGTDSSPPMDPLARAVCVEEVAVARGVRDTPSGTRLARTSACAMDLPLARESARAPGGGWHLGRRRARPLGSAQRGALWPALVCMLPAGAGRACHAAPSRNRQHHALRGAPLHGSEDARAYLAGGGSADVAGWRERVAVCADSFHGKDGRAILATGGQQFSARCASSASRVDS